MPSMPIKPPKKPQPEMPKKPVTKLMGKKTKPPKSLINSF